VALYPRSQPIPQRIVAIQGSSSVFSPGPMFSSSCLPVLDPMPPSRLSQLAPPEEVTKSLAPVFPFVFPAFRLADFSFSRKSLQAGPEAFMHSCSSFPFSATRLGWSSTFFFSVRQPIPSGSFLAYSDIFLGSFSSLRTCLKVRFLGGWLVPRELISFQKLRLVPILSPAHLLYLYVPGKTDSVWAFPLRFLGPPASLS